MQQRILLLVMCFVLTAGGTAFANDKLTGYKAGTFTKVDNCIACDFITKVVTVTNDIGQRVYEQLQNGILTLLGLGLALWILVNVAKLLFPFTPLEQASSLNNMMANRVVIVMLVATFLLNFNNFWSYLYVPVVGTGMTYAYTVMEKTVDVIGADANFLGMNGACQQAFQNAMAAAGEAGTNQMIQRLHCLIQGMTKTIGIGLDIAFASIAFQSRNFLLDLGKFIANIIPALLLIYTYGMILLFLSFRILDVVIRWGILVVFSPLIVGAAALPATRQFTIKCIKGIVEGVFEIIIIATLIGLAAVAMSTIKLDGGGAVTDIEQLKAQLTKEVTINIGITQPLFWQLWFVGVITDSVMDRAKSLAKIFADSGQSSLSGTDVTSKLAQDLLTKAQGAAQSIGGSAIKGFTK